MRLIICPLVILAVMKIILVEMWVENGSTIMLVSFFAAIAPCAATVNQFAILYDGDAKYASSINILSTLACVVTMPAMVYLFSAADLILS